MIRTTFRDGSIVSLLMLALAACSGEGTVTPEPVTPTPTASATAAPTAAPEAGYGYEFEVDKFGKPVASAAPAAGAAPSGRLPPEVIQQSVRSNFPAIRTCYEAGLKTNPKLAGRVTVKFVIGKEGKVSDPTAAGDLGDAGVVKCITDAFATFSFPPPSGGIVTVVYPIEFSPGEPKPAKERVVGTWKFDFSGEPRAAVEAALKKKAGKDEKKLAKLMKEAEDEAAASYFEITADSVTSKIGDKVLFRIKYAVVKEEGETLRVKVVGKPEGPQKGPKAGEEVVLLGDKGLMAFKDENTLVMTDPKKGALVYRRK